MDSALWKTNVRILWSGRFLVSTGLTGISPFIPFFMESLNHGDTENRLLWSGLALAAPALSYAIMTPLWGKVSDRWSRKWMVVRALSGLALSMFFMGIAQTPFQFFLFRLCQGAFGGISDASSAFIGAEAPKNRQGYTLGKMENASALGLLLGPFLGGILVEFWGCRPLLLLMGLLTGCCAIIAAIFLTETRSQTKAESIHNSIWKTFASLYQHRAVRAFILAGILVKVADFATFAIFTPYVEQMIQSSATAIWAGILLAMTSFGELVGAPWWGKKNDCQRIEYTFIWAAFFCSVCMLIQTYTLSLQWLLIVRFLQGFSYSALLQSVMLYVLRTSDMDNQGVRIGATNSLLMIGQITGPFLGSFLGSHIGFPFVFLVMGIVLAFTSMIIWYSSLLSSNRNLNVHHKL
ncbi:MFS transporter [Aneurinibacillus thermoaerophilus]|uniref:MFS transporter n=1 Tax=Aneurinibacillus thermoaerophilus TaxID=143495 RepID=UPI002E1DD644|nr:MFS transporter [Aneurinibacillus thermoaerophilus]MED0680507.1 MFS transporter [Aneurinibacillus thermoaerophilus]MED0738116.1 MFS transporter [Aneurinibacillus thermoaerophilus]MED0764853.1 MFS transporter [Aneurinibacillus thermoaerophilus]